MTDNRWYKYVDNNRGSAMVVAMILLIVMTIIGIAAVKTSNLEMMVSNAEKKKRSAFYAAEAGIEHAKFILKRRFREVNGPRAAAQQPMVWTFALDGSETVVNNGEVMNVNAATDTNFNGGAEWVRNVPLGRYTYSVRVWDNVDDGSPTNDVDAMIYMRSVATSVDDGRSGIEIALRGGFVGDQGSVTGYIAQAGAGAGKNYNANDVNAITDFSSQLK